ncbi:hypothetical protein [Abditibacterium utsteinense]|uniref:hypothetical protein n=1 Tax=Abditibacterium utsteinense TaxID=1960156 RepID=UPI00130062A0|nr:hypothetical protein [Abditibacterium utsteinense]
MPTASLSRLALPIAASLLISSQLANAQEAPAPNVATSPEAAPAPEESAAQLETEVRPELETDAATVDTTVSETATPEIPAEEIAPEAVIPQKMMPAGSTRDLPAPAAPPSRLVAENISYSGGLIIAEGTPEKPVIFETSAGKITAQRVQLDTVAQKVEASGSVQLERQIQTARRALRPRGLKRRTSNETTTETLFGQNLKYSFKDQSGQLDNARLQLASLFISTSSLTINGRRYTAKNVVVRPGSLSPADVKIYGTPPLNIRAKSLTATLGSSTLGSVPGGSETSAASGNRSAVAVQGGALFFRNTKILPLPSYVFRSGIGGGGGNGSTFKLTPSLSFNSADRVLVTTRLSFPLSKTPGQLTSFADIGLSQRIGVRGGAGLESNTKFGSLTLRARRADVVETQLTNRIELDRKPELIYNSPSLLSFALPGGRRAGFSIGGSYGSYGERRIGDDQSTIQASRFTTRLLFTTRLREVGGPFLRLFASNSRYGGIETRYKNRGFEVGYDGQLLPRVRGQISLRSTSLSGQTPFRFDEVEIARELRSTFDIELTPRYLLPVDLRYDLARRSFRDKSFGILRSYKVFAYGVVYQAARQDLRLEVRQGF